MKPNFTATTALGLISSALIACQSHAGLIASWQAEGNVLDSAGTNHGALINGASYASPGYDSSSAFNLDGVDDFIQVPDSPFWTFGTGDFSIAMWVNFDTERAGAQGTLPNMLIGHDEGPGVVDKWTFFYTADTDKLQFLFSNEVPTGENFLEAPIAWAPTLNQWHHVAMTRVGNTITFFADGVSLGSDTATLSTISNAGAPLTIGQAENLGYFDGQMDSILVYDHALSQSEINTIANVPEPTALAMIGLGSALLLKRKNESK